MIKELLEPLYHLCDGYKRSFFQPHIPHELYWAALIFTGVVFLMLLCFLKQRKDGVRVISLTILFEILLLIYSSTVVFRPASAKTGLRPMPFWSYTSIAEGREQLVMDNILNVLVFIPVGLLCGFAFKRPSILKAVSVGTLSSTTIEVSQFVFQRGVAEFDDIMHNTLGCVIGYLICLSIKVITRDSISFCRSLIYKVGMDMLKKNTIDKA